METLIQKYFEGESSLQEEAQIKAYFEQPEIHASLHEYQSVFNYFQAEQQVELSHDFEQKLMEKLTQPTLVGKPKVRRLNSWVLRVAAAVMLAISAWWLYPTTQTTQTSQVDWAKYEPKSPEDAFRITQAALLKTSSELNQGASRAASEVNKIQEISKFLK